MSEIPSIVNGIPTAPDVKKLTDKFNSLAVGDFISYKNIEQTIGALHGTGRWATVVTAWRKQLFRELNIILIPEPGKGFKVANPEERVHLSSSRFTSGMRKVKFSKTVAATTPAEELTPELARARTHLIAVGAALELAARTQAKELAYPTPTKAQKS